MGNSTQHTISAQGKTFSCEEGSNLRRVLLQQGIKLHNGRSQLINCRGIGTCGTCAVGLEGDVETPTWREASRLALPPHQPERKRRLACQIQVHDDLKVSKFDGFWGHGEQQIW